MLRRTEQRELSRREALQILAAAAPLFTGCAFGKEAERPPKRISITEALDFYQNQEYLHERMMIVAAGWRSNSEPGEEDWFEELGQEEFEAEDFFDDFADAEFQLWVR